MAATDHSIDIGDLSESREPPRAGSMWMRPLEAIAATLLVAIVLLLLAGVTSRYVFSLPVVWIDEVASICFLWLAMLGTARCSRPV